MSKLKKPQAELLVDKRTVNKEMVLNILRGGKILSYGEMLQAFGVPLRDIPEEIALMDEIRIRQKAGEKVKFDRATSFRLRLIDVLDQLARDEMVSKAIRPDVERDAVCYFLKSERGSLLERGAIVVGKGGLDTLDASWDFEARMGILASIRGSRVERLA